MLIIVYQKLNFSFRGCRCLSQSQIKTGRKEPDLHLFKPCLRSEKKLKHTVLYLITLQRLEEYLEKDWKKWKNILNNRNNPDDSITKSS